MNNSDLLELFKLYSNRQREWLELWIKSVSIFITIIISMFTGTIISIFFYASNEYFILTSVGPITALCLSILGKQTCKRFYQRYLEDITVVKKLEDELDPSRKNIAVFPNDKSILPVRWRRHLDDPELKDGADFIKTRLDGGVNRYSNYVFKMSILLASLGFIFIWYIVYIDGIL